MLELPTPYVARTRENERLGRQLWNLKRIRQARPVALVGATGFGKSVVVAAVSRSNVIGEMYPKGIVWLEAASEASLRDSIAGAIKGLTDHDVTVMKVSEGLTELFALIEGKDALVVLDNLNAKELANEFRAHASEYAIALTTHKRSVVTTLQCKAWEMRGMTTKESFRLLAKSGQLRVNRELYEKLRSAVASCGKVPAVVHSFGLLLVGRSPSRVNQFLDLAENNRGPIRDLASALFDLTTNELTATELEQFEKFAVFDPNEAIPECVIELLLSDGQPHEDSLSTLDRFVDLNLLRFYEYQNGREEARYLLRESTDPRILLKCLRILSGSEAKGHARQLLPPILSGDLDDLVASRCLQVLGEDAKDAASSLIRTTTKPEVLMACVDVLGQHGDKAVFEVAERTENELVAKKCIEHLRVDAVDVARIWHVKAKSPQTIELCKKVICDSSAN